MDNRDRISLADFKYSYSISSKEDRLGLIQSVHRYPNRFDMDVSEYVDYIWNKRYEIYSLIPIEFTEVLSDSKYKDKKYNHSVHISPEGFKIYDSAGDEVGQGIYDFQKSLKLVQVYYYELLRIPTECRASTLLNSLLRHKYGDDIVINYL